LIDEFLFPVLIMLYQFKV